MAQRDLRNVEKALAKIEDAQAELRAAIVAAHRSGETLKDIGDRAGMTPQRIHQIVRAADDG